MQSFSFRTTERKRIEWCLERRVGKEVVGGLEDRRGREGEVEVYVCLEVARFSATKGIEMESKRRKNRGKQKIENKMDGKKERWKGKKNKEEIVERRMSGGKLIRKKSI